MRHSVFSLPLLVFLCLLSPPASLSADEYPTREEMRQALRPPVLARTVASIPRPDDRKPSLALRLQFDLASDRLRPESEAPLQDLAAVLREQELSAFVYRIEGHTCDMGPEDYNLDLSRRRAAAVFAWLTTHGGLPARQFRVEGFGESRRVAQATTEDARRQNRRVEIVNTLEKFDNAAILPSGGVAVRLKRKTRDGEIVMRDGDRLTKAEDYALEFKSDRPVYLHAFQVDAAGVAAALFPNPAYSKETNPVAPGRIHRVPDAGWLYLSGAEGEERIVVVADYEEIADPKTVCLALLREGLHTPGDLMLFRGVSGVGSEAPVTRALGGVRQEEEIDEPHFAWKRMIQHQ